MNSLIIWESTTPDVIAEVSEAPAFVARGMHRVFGRSDHFGARRSYNMDIWQGGDGRLLMRC